MNFKSYLLGLALMAAGLVQAAGPATASPLSDKQAAELEKGFRASFRRDNPKYWLHRLEQDEAMRLCSRSQGQPSTAERARIQQAQLAAIRYPVDGKLVGDWKEGEKLASSGRGGHIGFIQPDPPMTPRGGNCYACHQLAKKEIAFGTIGPSLQQFGKLRGANDDVAKYVYDKIYDSNAFNACSNMPRFGLHQWLTPEQITHLVAFLLDPKSPVNE